jgi:hypothetical protein
MAYNEDQPRADNGQWSSGGGGGGGHSMFGDLSKMTDKQLAQEKESRHLGAYGSPAREALRAEANARASRAPGSGDASTGGAAGTGAAAAATGAGVSGSGSEARP